MSIIRILWAEVKKTLGRRNCSIISDSNLASLVKNSTSFAKEYWDDPVHKGKHLKSQNRSKKKGKMLQAHIV